MKVRYLNSVGKNSLWKFIRILYTTKKELSLGGKIFTLVYQFVLNQLKLINPTCKGLIQVCRFLKGLIKNRRMEVIVLVGVALANVSLIHEYKMYEFHRVANMSIMK